MNLFQQLKNRNVFKVASVYLVTSWVILQIVSVLTPYLHLPLVFGTVVAVILAIGFPVACIFAWAFELTPEGLKFSSDVAPADSIRERTGSKINHLLSVSLAAALLFIAWDHFYNPGIDESKELSIAVLPFQDMSADQSQEYFGDGMAEEILNALARIKSLVVISRTSSFAFKNKNDDIRTIGQTLGVNYVLEGSIRKDNRKIRITAQLIDVASGRHVWSETYDRKLEDIFALQDELTLAITRALQLNLLPEEVSHEAGMTDNQEAYELFVRGRELVYERAPETLPQAKEYLEQALALDNDFHLARAQLWAVYWVAERLGVFSQAVVQAEQQQIFMQLQVAPDFPLKHFVLAGYLEDHQEVELAGQSIMQAYEQAPNEPLIENWALQFISFYSGVDEGIRQRLEVKKRNPLDKLNLASLVTNAIIADRPDLVEETVLALEKLDPESSFTGEARLEQLYTLQHDPVRALAYLHQFQGTKGRVMNSAEIGLNILLNNNLEAIRLISQTLRDNPEGYRDYETSFILLMHKEWQGTLSEEELQAFHALVVPAEFQQEVSMTLSLLLGDPAPFELAFAEEGVISEKHPAFQGSVRTSETILYSAMMKKAGKTTLLSLVQERTAQYVPGCLSSHFRWYSVWCTSLVYINDSLPPETRFEYFKESLPVLCLRCMGVESFILTSPMYFGVSDHPDFNRVANQFLDDTYRKWAEQGVVADSQ